MNVIHDLQMTNNHAGTSNGAPLPYSRAPGNTNAAGHRRVITNGDVVSDLNLIIEFHAIADDGIVKRAAINRGIRANFHIVADDDTTDLRNLDPAFRILGKAKTIAANYGSGMNNGPFADNAAAYTTTFG